MINWDAVGAVGEIIGAAAVVVTLVNLALQMRHNAAATRAETAQSLADSINEANLLLAADPELARLYSEGKFGDWDSLNDIEKVRWSYFATAGCRSFEAVFTNARLNKADEQTFRMIKGLLKKHFESAAWKTWWLEQGEQPPYTEDFVRFVRDECL